MYFVITHKIIHTTNKDVKLENQIQNTILLERYYLYFFIYTHKMLS